MDDLLKCKYAPVIAGVKFQCAGNYGHSGPHTFHNEAPDFDCIQQRLDTGGWIPVAERFPEEGEEVLVAYVAWGLNTGISHRCGSEWDGIDDEVTHWQPLPALPKEK